MSEPGPEQALPIVKIARVGTRAVPWQAKLSDGEKWLFGKSLQMTLALVAASWGPNVEVRIYGLAEGTEPQCAG